MKTPKHHDGVTGLCPDPHLEQRSSEGQVQKQERRARVLAENAAPAVLPASPVGEAGNVVDYTITMDSRSPWRTPLSLSLPSPLPLVPPEGPAWRHGDITRLVI